MRKLSHGAGKWPEVTEWTSGEVRTRPQVSQFQISYHIGPSAYSYYARSNFSFIAFHIIDLFSYLVHTELDLSSQILRLAPGEGSQGFYLSIKGQL